MFGLFILGFLSTLHLIVVQSKPSLIILKNNNGIEESISSVLKIKPGINISLTCKTIDTIPRKENYFDSVAWSKEINHDSFHKEAANKIINKTVPSQLYFKPIKIDDGGTYFCTNTKYNLFKILQVIVRSNKKPLNGESRWKRAQYNYGHGMGTHKPYIYKPERLPAYIEDILSKGNKYVSADETSHVYPWQRALNENEGPPSDYIPEDQQDESEKVHYFVGGVTIMFLFGVIFMIVRYRKYNRRQPQVNSRPVPDHTINPPVTTVQSPIPGRSQDPDSNNIVTLLNALDITPIDRSNVQPRRHSDVLPSNNFGQLPNSAMPRAPIAPMFSRSDEPPSYDNFARNPNLYDASSAPPSYDEAMTTSLRIFGEEPQNVTVNAPLVSPNDI